MNLASARLAAAQANIVATQLNAARRPQSSPGDGPDDIIEGEFTSPDER